MIDSVRYLPLRCDTFLICSLPLQKRTNAKAKVVAIKQEEKAETEMVGDMALLQPSKVCTGQNEMRTVLMEEVDADKVVVRQVNGNGDFGICVCLKEKKAVAIACWERSGVNGKREYRFCSMAPKFREFSKAL